MNYKYAAVSLLAIPLMGTAFVGAVFQNFYSPTAKNINDAMNGKVVGAPLPSRAASSIKLEEYKPK